MTEMKLAWVSSTPLGTPVDPDVYMISARSSSFGRMGIRSTVAPGPFVPASIRLSSECRSPRESIAGKLPCPTSALPMNTTCLSVGTLSSTVSLRLSYRSYSTKMISASVWLRPCSIASCPSVA